MNKTIATLCITAALVAGTFVFAQSQNQPKAAPDERIDKLLEQNEKILKNQDEILKQLSAVQESLLILKRRSS